MNEAIGIRDVSKVFGQGDTTFTAVARVNISIRENEFFTLLGPSGCGKTTLLRMIAGFEFPTDGEILLHGENIADMPPFRRPINTVFQNYALFPHMTVADNIGFGLRMLGKSKAEVSERVIEMLRLVKMEPMAGRRTSEISGGQQQRVALARALAPQPKVLLLDEPLSALDYKLRKEMQLELKRMQHETGITFIFVTHDQEEALTMSDRIAVMSKGQVLQVGSPRDIYDAPADRFVAEFIGETNFLTGRVRKIAEETAEVMLEGGAAISATAAGVGVGDDVTIVVRPEHAEVVAVPATGSAVTKGTLENVVYFGTDTHFHVRLPDGSVFVTRQQNRPRLSSEFAVGSEVSIAVAADAARILRAGA
ncbi:ABC transporter ATP-binding protein [Ruegeria sp. PrR005]|nr:ABC transporter ATP-binding protein [Ruegeria sp. PrR005]